ncbi:hypothetical protein SERLA73DRAFT_80406 [Serpula lacrymans var. lacrymans S7.3]|uniref:Uncharacterized protein n=1 Tax=Serpula lacrymans var. lacrymans (strain S7.3) TaxID=936435 RepID=F8QJN3_SERL3|nr:hypothetical protein SERLA73DRAFT_80406 [Serpula lacrymans var. lacrymans S7.3]
MHTIQLKVGMVIVIGSIKKPTKDFYRTSPTPLPKMQHDTQIVKGALQDECSLVLIGSKGSMGC